MKNNAFKMLTVAFCEQIIYTSATKLFTELPEDVNDEAKSTVNK